MYKYLLFDADNTLLDFDAAEKSALTDTLNECPLGFSEQTHKRYHDINKEEWEKLERKETTVDALRINRFVRLLCEFGYSEEDGTAAAKIYAKKLCNYAPMMPGAEEVLGKLSADYDVYIVTNGISVTQRSRFAIAGLGRYAKHIFISEEIGAAKPDKRFFDAVIAEIDDSDLSNYLVIGDSLTSDITGAYNYGIDSVWLNYGGGYDQRPAYTISKIEDLLAIL